MPNQRQRSALQTEYAKLISAFAFAAWIVQFLFFIIQNLQPVAIVSACTGRFELDLVENHIVGFLVPWLKYAFQFVHCHIMRYLGFCGVFFACAKTKTLFSYAETTQTISVFVLATQNLIVQIFFLLNLKLPRL